MHTFTVALISILTFVTSTVWATDAVEASARMTNGSTIAVVCKNADGSIRSVETLDLYDGRTLYKLNLASPSGSVDEHLGSVREKLQLIFKDLPQNQSPSSLIDKASADMQLSDEDMIWAPVEESSTVALPQECGLERLADYQSGKLMIKNGLWSEMDTLHRASVIVHEAVNALHDNVGENSLARTRKITGYLFSDFSFEPLLAGVPTDANECTARHSINPNDVAFHFFKYQNPQNDIEEVLQFTTFRNQQPYAVTTVITPKWSWPKEEGDLYKDVNSSIDDFDQLYIRRESSANGESESFYFDELNGDYYVSCAKSPQSPLGLLRITSVGAFESVAVGGRRTLMFEVSNLGEGKTLSMGSNGMSAPFSFVGGSYPGIGGTCAKNLEPKSKCLLAIEFAPVATGNFSSMVSLNYNNGTSQDAVTADMNGTGASPAQITISDSPSYWFGSVTAGFFREVTIRLTNEGGIRATGLRDQGLQAPFGFKGGKFPGEGGTCGDFLDAAGTCNLIVTFSPTQIGPFKDTLEIVYSNGAIDNTSTREISGTGVAPAMLAASGSEPMDLGVTAVGSFVDVTITFTNTGGSNLSDMKAIGLAAPFTFANGYYPGKGGTCYSSLSPSASCTMVIRYMPTVTSSSTDTLEVSYNDGASKRWITKRLVASGASPALVTISSGPTYNFGFVSPGSAVDYTFTVANVGAVSATALAVTPLEAPFSFSEGAYPGKGGTCAQTLAPGATCTVRVRFAPEEQGDYASVLKFDYFNGIAPQSTLRSLAGKAGEPAQLTMTAGTVFSFGKVDIGSPVDVTFTIVNTGGSTALSLRPASSFAGTYAFKGGNYPGEGGTCGDSLDVFQMCTVVVSFAPSLPGLHKETLAVSYFNGVSKQIAVQYLEGTGISTRGHEPWNLLFTGL